MTTSTRTFTIGALSREGGCSVDTIRYYERLRLMPRVTRTEGGHRLYNGEHARRLGFIRRSRALGLGLTQIRGMLEAMAREAMDCDRTQAVLEAQLAEVRRRVAEFRRLEHDLNALIGACRSGAEPSCRVDEPCCHVIESWHVEGKSTVGQPRPPTGKRDAASALRLRSRSA